MCSYAAVVACSADEDIDSKFPTNVVIESTGECSWVPLGLYISSCAIDIKVRRMGLLRSGMYMAYDVIRASLEDFIVVTLKY